VLKSLDFFLTKRQQSTTNQHRISMKGVPGNNTTNILTFTRDLVVRPAGFAADFAAAAGLAAALLVLNLISFPSLGFRI